jgi:hypothetical protein
MNDTQLSNIQREIRRRKSLPFRQEMARKDMLHYARYMFAEFHEIEFLEAWYHELLCRALTAVYRGEIRRLIINMPPSYGKTEFAVKLFISWVLGQNPGLRSIYATYSDSLATETPADVKSMVTSEVYGEVFGAKKLNKTADQKWYLDKNGRKDGGMYSTTISGGITGFHGDFLIIDDPMKAIEANSAPARKVVEEFYTGSSTTRLRKSNPNAAIIIIMQRLHEKDLVGYLEENEPGVWTHINLTGIEPAETVYDFMDFYYVRPANEPLNPLFEDVAALEAQMLAMHEKWFSQYQQDPKTIKTGYVTEADYAYVAKWEIAEDTKCISIDPAESIKQTADDRAISLIGCSINKEKIELYNVYGTWHGKWKNEDFIDQIITVMIDNPGVPVFMESSGGGILTEQYLKKKIAVVNTERKQEGLAIITNRVKLFTPKTTISKNLKIDASIDPYLRNHQIRFVIGGNGQEQVKKEYEAFHPEKDSKEDNCIETIANVVVNDFIVPKPAKAPKKEAVQMERRAPLGRSGGRWRV